MARSSKRLRLARHAALTAAAVSCAALLAGCGEQPPVEAVASHVGLFGR